MSDQLAREIATIVELFKRGGWDHLHVESEGLTLLLSTDPAAGMGVTAAPVTVVETPVAPSPLETGAFGPASVTAARDLRWRPIVAPNLGTFYRSPKPGAAPFVEIGAAVAADTEICLLEVMKLFTSVKAGSAGIIREIVASDAQLVEGGQPLFYIEPQEA